MIGVGITQFGNDPKREDAIRKTLELCEGFKVHVSRDIYGIAKAKNDCLRNLMDCEHIFLFDSDCYPLVKGWEQYYIQSGMKHLCYTDGRFILGFDGNITIYEKPDGCMLYIHRDCINAVGGFDEEFKVYAGEHQNYSDRIYNAGLTPNRYMDLTYSNQFIHWMDKNKEVTSTLNHYIKAKHIPGNMKRVHEQRNSKQFIPLI